MTMTPTGIGSLDRALEESLRWVQGIVKELELPYPHRAYSALRSVLHAIRDQLPFEEATALAARLPAVIRGGYLEGWKPTEGVPREASREAFLTRVAERLMEVPDLAPEPAARAVFALLSREIPDLRSAWPEPLHGFWPAARPPGPLPSDEARHARSERTRKEIEAAIASARAEGVSEKDLPAVAPGKRGARSARAARAPRGGVFDKAVHKILSWVKDLRLRRVVTREGAFKALVGVLRTVRDRMTRQEAVHLGTQLPMILRGFYFEGWDPGQGPLRERRKEEFLARVERSLDGAAGMGAEIATRAVFALLGRRVTEGELEDVRGSLPGAVRDLWPTERAPSRGTTVGGKPPADTASRGGATPRSRARKARKEIRRTIALARARGVRDQDLPLLMSRKSTRKPKRRNPW